MTFFAKMKIYVVVGFIIVRHCQGANFSLIQMELIILKFLFLSSPITEKCRLEMSASQLGISSNTPGDSQVHHVTPQREKTRPSSVNPAPADWLLPLSRAHGHLVT